MRPDPAKIAISERLFLETRFSQFFFAHSRGDANTTLTEGDSVVAQSATTEEPLYFDTCCHVNAKGSQIMAREIAARIGA